MKMTLAVAHQTFLLLRRDKIFVPAVIAGIMITGLANLASDWSIEDFRKILFDVGVFGFHLAGSLVAIFWGTKIIGDARADGAVEVELSAPISRSSWLIGKFLGISFSLLLLGAFLLAFWQAFMLLNRFGWLTHAQLTVFGLQFLGWIVIAATAIFFSAFCGTTVALFCTFCMWLVGLVSSLILATLSDKTSVAMRLVIESVARVWDLQQFNIVNHAVVAGPLPQAEILYRVGYGGVLIALLVSLACVIFSRRDLIQ